MQNLTHLLKSMLAFSMLFLFGQQALMAQKTPIKRTHAISEPVSGHLQTNGPATGVLNVVAIMVEFQPDSNRLTSGTGIFGEDGMEGLPFMRNAEDVRIEPLPHNQNYFEAHLEFAKNYYEKSSDGQLTLDYQVLPDIYRLPKKMEAYSPTGETFTNEKVAQMVRDAWQQVEENGGFDATGLDPENTAFVIFHAGIGRDIELTGTNLDITPFDIPSLYLRKDNLSNLLDSPTFDGFAINDGDFRVTNSMIIPRTESRRGEDIQNNEFVFSLSINGLLIASIGSHLGLPDLFNTETGDPAIGRFGLMDGAGFFAYNGLLPPEPSAWEKIYLGWQTPFLVDTNTPDSISLPASSLNQPNSIAKYQLSGSEYFLIENRHRDPENSENAQVTLTIQQPNGDRITQTFSNKDESFVFQEADFDTLLEAGTFVNASNFDFSLPGGFDEGQNENDESDDRNLNGGILIWHIDEAMIATQLSNERVNADPERRGVDLEEADGAQDIGGDFSGALDNSAAFGTAFDFWWSGNNYTAILENGREISLYDNRFGSDTRPDNRSNSGAPSFFELYDFSDNRPTASFKIRAISPDTSLYTPVFSFTDKNESLFTPQDNYWDYFPLSIGFHEGDDDTLLVIPGHSTISVYDLQNPQEGEFEKIEQPSNQQPLLGDHFIIAENPGFANTTSGQIQIRSVANARNTVAYDWMVNAPFNQGFISSQQGDTLIVDFTNSSFLIQNGAQSAPPTQFDFISERVNGKYAGISGSTVTFVGEDVSDYQSTSQNRLFAGTIKTGENPLYYIFEEDAFTLVDPSLEIPFTLIFEEETAEWPAITKNLEFYRINRSKNQIEGHNPNGALLENTPISAPDGVQFIGTPLIADITGDEAQDILVVGQDQISMSIYAYEKTGQPIEGFPLYVGEIEGQQTQPIHPSFYGNTLYAVSHNSDIKAWEFHNFTSADWPSRYGTNSFNKVSGSVNQSTSGNTDYSVLNKKETYNWPNPAGDETNIRFEVAQPGGTVDISVITVSGRIIFEETVETPGGIPQEVHVNTQHWGSGGYIARIKATVEGKSETKLIKIGIVH